MLVVAKANWAFASRRKKRLSDFWRSGQFRVNTPVMRRWNDAELLSAYFHITTVASEDEWDVKLEVVEKMKPCRKLEARCFVGKLASDQGALQELAVRGGLPAA